MSLVAAFPASAGTLDSLEPEVDGLGGISYVAHISNVGDAPDSTVEMTVSGLAGGHVAITMTKIITMGCNGELIVENDVGLEELFDEPTRDELGEWAEILFQPSLR